MRWTNSNGTACTAQAKLVSQISQYQACLAGPSVFFAAKWARQTHAGGRPATRHRKSEV
jgi:hypothetical protein